MPLEKWNGKFAGVGNGGWAGTISFARPWRPAPARLCHGVDQHRPRGGAGVEHGPVRTREAGTTHRLRLPRPSRDGGQVQEPGAGVLRQAARARVFHRLLVGRLRRSDGGPAFSLRLRRRRRRRAGEQLDPADGGRFRWRARGSERPGQPPATPGARPAPSRGARRLRQRGRRRRRGDRGSAALPVRSGHTRMHRRPTVAHLSHQGAGRGRPPRVSRADRSQDRGAAVSGPGAGQRTVLAASGPRQPLSDSSLALQMAGLLRCGLGLENVRFQRSPGLRGARQGRSETRPHPQRHQPGPRGVQASAEGSCCSITAGTTS